MNVEYEGPPAYPEDKCPVCRARIRDSRVCARCGADLAPVMKVLLLAWRSREEARQALRDGDYAEAARLADESQFWRDTPEGRRLLLLAEVGAGG